MNLKLTEQGKQQMRDMVTSHLVFNKVLPNPVLVRMLLEGISVVVATDESVERGHPENGGGG